MINVIPFDHVLMFSFFSLLYGLPALILALILNKRLKLNIMENFVIALAISFIGIHLLQFVLNIFTFPFGFALIATSWFLWVVSSLILAKTYGISLKVDKDWKSYVFVIVLIIAFAIRFASFSPVFSELDPYFYAYASYQLMNHGFVPPTDDTAWWPVINATHRTANLLDFMEATWYMLYKQVKGIKSLTNPYLLASVANYYPPFAAMFMVFLFYLFSKKLTNNVWLALALALEFTFLPTLLIKTMSGEFEAQPMGFFTMTGVIVMLYYLLKEKKMDYLFLASIFSIASLYGSASYIIPIFFTAALSFLFLLWVIINHKGEWELKVIAYYSTIFSLFFLLYLFYNPKPLSLLSRFLFSLLPIVFYATYFIIKKYLASLKSSLKIEYEIGAIILVLLVLFLSPIRSVVINIASFGLRVGQYNTALERTIQEQQFASKSLALQLGKWGQDLVPYLSDISTELVLFIINIFITIVNVIMSFSIPYLEKQSAFGFFIVLLFIIRTIYELYIILKNKKLDLGFWVVAIIFYPLMLPTLVKAKYEIFFAYAFAYILAYVSKDILVYTLEFLKKDLAGYKPYIAPVLALLIMLFGNSLNLYNFFLIKHAFTPKLLDNPKHFSVMLSMLCQEGMQSACLAKNYTTIADLDDYNLCVLSKFKDRINMISDIKKISQAEVAAASLYCRNINRKWIESMDWIREKSLNNSRITSWWDYGHWINFFGLRNAVLRNEHSSLEMIYSVAHAYIMGNETELKALMHKYGSVYALFDREILFGANGFGGKFYALNYLACVKANLTNKHIPQLQSQCEHDNMWETIIVSNELCTVSNITNKIGKVAYRIVYKNDSYKKQKAYCLSTTKLVNGQEINALYYLNESYSNGDLKLNKAFLLPMDKNTFALLYTKDPVWIEDGKVKSGWEDRKGRFYDSSLYKAFVLNELDGFEKVFDNGYVKIYKLKV